MAFYLLPRKINLLILLLYFTCCYTTKVRTKFNVQVSSPPTTTSHTLPPTVSGPLPAHSLSECNSIVFLFPSSRVYFILIVSNRLLWSSVSMGLLPPTPHPAPPLNKECRYFVGCRLERINNIKSSFADRSVVFVGRQQALDTLDTLLYIFLHCS